MFTGSEEFEDLKGYLKSGRVLESKLQKISTLKNAIKSIEMLPGKSISEQPPEVENEDDDPIEIHENGIVYEV